MVELNFLSVINLNFHLAKFSSFVFVPFDFTNKLKKYHRIISFSISTGLSLIGWIVYDGFLPTYVFVPSKIMEFGLNVMLKFSIFITIIIKFNNFIKKGEFSVTIKKIIWCNNLVN